MKMCVKMSSGQDDDERPRIDFSGLNEAEVKKVLSKAVIQPDFDQRPVPDVSVKSLTRRKRERKMEREKTAGEKWFHMPATELTEERQRDLELLQMRRALDPRAHYRKADRAVLPKYFQVGEVVDSPADFYASRLTRKERKRTMVEELMQDVEFVARNRRKYTEVLSKKRRTRTGPLRRGHLPRQSKYKNKAKSH